MECGDGIDHLLAVSQERLKEQKLLAQSYQIPSNEASPQTAEQRVCAA